MKSDRNILIAFLLNFLFSVFEFFGGIYTGSAAILSDAVHDMADAISIGFSYILEKGSKRKPDETFTFGYGRYSVLGSLITITFLLAGSAFAIYNAAIRLLNPVKIDYSGMILIAIIGLCVNLTAAICTRKGTSLNQKAVNLHMLEDVMGWIIVLIGAVIMHFTDISIIDPIISIAVSVYILIKALQHLKEVIDIFLMKAPKGCSVQLVKNNVMGVSGVVDVHHIHIWSLDGYQHCASMHVVTDLSAHTVRHEIQHSLQECGIKHVTIEIEKTDESCHTENCNLGIVTNAGHNHAAHHHNH